MKFKYLLFLLAFINASLFAVEVNNGIINYEIASEEEKVIRLDGEWEFYKGQTFSMLGLAQLKNDFVQVPGTWSDNSIESKSSVMSYGCNTYRIMIMGLRANSEYGIFSRSSPALAARVFANGKFIAQYGNFARHKDDYKPAQVPMICSLTANERGVIELVIQVSNFTQPNGGILAPIMFGQYSDILTKYILTLVIISAIVGCLVFILVINFLTWIFDKNHTPSFYFSIFVLLLIFRVLCGSVNALSVYLPSFGFAFQAKLRDLALLSFGFFSIVYRYDKYFTLKHPKMDRNISAIALGLFIVFICAPTESIFYVQRIILMAALAFLIYSFVRMYFSIVTHQFYVAAYTCFYSAVFIGIALDNLFIAPIEVMFVTYSELGIILLVFIVVAYLAIFLERLVSGYLHQKNELSQNYVAYRKLVLGELPHILGKENFGKIELGDYAELEATIMVVGEVVVPPDNTQISLREQFETIGFYSSKIIEVVEQAGGMVLSIADNSITAIFTKSSKDAVAAAHEIQNLLEVMNTRRIQDYYPSVSFNIGLHHGPILLGVVGCQSRIDYTIVSPNIELANNICSLGFYKNIPVLISEAVALNLVGEDMATLQEVGKIKFSECPYPIFLYGFKASAESDSFEQEKRVLTQRDVDKYLCL